MSDSDRRTDTHSDLTLRDRLAAGDPQAFRLLYSRHHGAMVRVAQSIVKDRAAAEDAAQETWVALIESLDQYEGRSPLASWIFAILINKARTRASRDGRSVSLAAEAGELDGDPPEAGMFDAGGGWREAPGLWHDMTPERIAGDRQLLDRVKAAMEDLPPLQRAVLIMRGQQGLDPETVCGLLELSPGNMRVLLHRARLRLRGALAPHL